MVLLWKYLRPQRGLAGLALLLAAVSQVLMLVDPIILGWLIDDYANQRDVKSEDELVRGALGLLVLAIAVAIASAPRVPCRVRDAAPGARFGTQSSRRPAQTMRMNFRVRGPSIGAPLSLLRRVRRDTERFINAFINAVCLATACLPDLVLLTNNWALVPFSCRRLGGAS